MSKPALIIANRGEIACRVIRAAKSLSLRTVAVFSDADEDAPHVAMADSAVRIGPAKPAESYLNQAAIIKAAQQSGAALLHPGYGFLSENPGFVKACTESGICFVGPSPEVMALMGDKEQARAVAAKAGVPVLPGSSRLQLNDPRSVAVSGDSIGFPLLVKAAAGGGGIGMRIVREPGELQAAVQACATLAQSAFGNGTVYLERYVERARHIEIQIFGFGDGSAIHLFERDCSLQRRHQKVIEEAPAPAISEDIRRRMGLAAVALAESCSYQGAGTVEFLYDVSTAEFFFLEMNTRIQVEHPVTEMVTGIDIVGAQIRLALGERLQDTLRQEKMAARGHAMEARVYAENPAKNFFPSPGLLTRLKMPEKTNVRYDAGYREGNRVTPFYDPMIAKVIAWGEDRVQAAGLLHEALCEIQLEGITTNIGYLAAVLNDEDFLAGNVNTGFLSQKHALLIDAGRMLSGV